MTYDKYNNIILFSKIIYLFSFNIGIKIFKHTYYL